VQIVKPCGLFTTTSDSSFLHPCILSRGGQMHHIWIASWKTKFYMGPDMEKQEAAAQLETESTPERGFTSWGPLVSYVSNGGSPPDK